MIPERLVLGIPYRLFLLDVAVFLAGLALSSVLGIRFSLSGLGAYWQLLDPVLLKSNLIHSVFLLHSQPPLFNLMVGLVLKALPGAAFAVLFRVMGFALLLVLTRILHELRISRWILAAVILLVGLHPDFLVYGSYLFYSLPTALLLVLSAASILAFQRTQRPVYAYLLGLFLLLCGLMRAVYHPVWLLLLSACLLFVMERSARKVLIPALVVPFVILCGWYMKNEMLVGQFTGSSWLGMNLARGWVLPDDPRWQGVKSLGFPITMKEAMELYQKKVVSPEFVQGPFLDPSFYRRFGYFKDSASADPALDAPYKSSGAPNFNHRDYARLSAQLRADALRSIRAYPDRYANRMLTAWKLFLQPGPNSVSFVVDYDFSRVAAYRDSLNRVLSGASPIFMPGGVVRFNLLYLLFPAVLLYAAVQMWKSAEVRPLFLFILVTVCWAGVVSNAIEIGENDRMRWELDALLLIPAAHALDALVRRFRKGAKEGPLTP